MDRSIIDMSKQEKLTLVHSLRSEGLTIDEISERSGIPRSSVGKYLKISADELRSHPGSMEISNPIRDEISFPEISKISLETRSHKETEISSRTRSQQMFESMDFCFKPSFTWREFLRCVALGIPVLSLLPWLICTSADVYKKDVGNFWCWIIAIGIEVFTVSIAAFLPKLDCKLSSPGELFRSFPMLLKVLFHYVLLLGLCFYSYTTTSLIVTENKIDSINEIRNSSLKSVGVADLRAEKSQMLKLISTYEKSGWLGEIRKIRDDLKEIDAKLQTEQSNGGFVDSESLAAVEHRNLVGKSLRLVVLFIVAYCLHVISGFLSNHQHVVREN